MSLNKTCSPRTGC